MPETRREVAERIVHETMLVVPGKIADKYVAAIEAALVDEVERCARLAERAQLPRGYQWGRDAMEQFNFGKERARQAILRGRADREP